MSYTSADLTAVDQAIAAIAAGNRVGEVTLNGKRIKYADVSLGELRVHRDQIARVLSRAARPRYQQIVTSKGL